MTKKPTDINPKRNEKHQQWDKLRYIPKLILLSGCAVFLAALSLVIATLSLYNSTDSNAKVDYELQATRAELTITKNLMTLHNVYLQELYFLLKENDIEPPPLPEE